ncbi:hypothetical protein PR048_023394 [Dryococelus australis]|uniref:Uncharacterized protein n=1 Tax=Dryococelus australis TaxID=614101 RepID=A0ABQ9GU40_9NEOP|nr:hypothetical protein PR048_023394 [Dryococelus australis]
MVASEKSEKPTEVKAVILLNLVGEDAVEVYNIFQVPDKLRPEKMCPMRGFYCTPESKKENEPFQLFVNDLRKLVRSVNLVNWLIQVHNFCVYKVSGKKKGLMIQPYQCQ